MNSIIKLGTFIFVLLYIISPIDLLPGFLVDDVLVAIVGYGIMTKEETINRTVKKITAFIKLGAVFFVILYVVNILHGDFDDVIQALFNFI